MYENAKVAMDARSEKWNIGYQSSDEGQSWARQVTTGNLKQDSLKETLERVEKQSADLAARLSSLHAFIFGFSQSNKNAICDLAMGEPVRSIQDITQSISSSVNDAFQALSRIESQIGGN